MLHGLERKSAGSGFGECFFAGHLLPFIQSPSFKLNRMSDIHFPAASYSSSQPRFYHIHLQDICRTPLWFSSHGFRENGIASADPVCANKAIPVLFLEFHSLSGDPAEY